MEKEIVMYARRRYTPFIALARDLLQRYQIPFREIDVEAEPAAAEQVRSWTGGLSLPTLIVVAPRQDHPLTPPEPLPPDHRSRGVPRGSLISEPNNRQLEDWLHQHGFLAKPYWR